MAAPLVRLEGRPDWDVLNAPIREALEILYQSEIRDMPVLEDLNAQEDMYEGSKYSPEGIAWAYVLRSNGADRLGTAARQYLEMEAPSRPGQDVDMFAPPPVDQAEAFAKAFGDLRTGKGKGTVSKEYPKLGEPVAQPGELQSLRRRGHGTGELGFDQPARTGGADRQESFFSSEDEAASQALEESRQKKLLGERLTAQFHSGQAVRPAGLKPAQQRGMFEEEGPEQGGLDLSEAAPTSSYSAQFPPSPAQKAPEKRGAASQRNMRIADLERQATQMRLTPEEQDELTNLRRERATRMAERRTQFERGQAPLFAEQIPEAKPEDFIRADEERERSRRESDQGSEQKARNYREAIAGAVSPERLDELDRGWESFKGPHKPAYHADYWLQHYRDVFKRNPMDVYRGGEPWPLPKTEGEERAKQAGLTEEEYLELKAPHEGEGEVQALRRVPPDQLPPVRRGLNDVQEILHDQVRKKIKADAPDALQQHRLVTESRKEVQEQLAKPVSGIGWYDADTPLANTDLTKAFPELKTNPEKLVLLNAMSAVTSSSHEAERESEQAAYIY
jgi:hypothetical protein